MQSRIADALQRLLPLYQGVHLHHARQLWKDHVSAFFHVDHPSLVNRFAELAEHANVGFLVWSNGQVKDSVGDTPWYEYRLNMKNGITGAMILCLDLISDLQKQGCLSHAEAAEIRTSIGYEKWCQT
jgi:hypothetical protein